VLVVAVSLLIGRVTDYERTEEVNFLAGEFNGIPGENSQTNGLEL
jgi:hypothetical protein